MDQTLEKHVMAPLPIIDRVRQVEGALFGPRYGPGGYGPGPFGW